NSCVCADTERESKNRHRGKAWTLAQCARAKSQVLRKLLEPDPAPGTARILLDQRDVAEGLHGGVAGVLAPHAGCHVLGDLLIEVELHLLVELLRGAAA